MTDQPYRPIPQRSGYAVELDTLVVHERYPDHAPGAYRTRPSGLGTLLPGGQGIPCPACFPETVRRPAARKPATKRTTKAKGTVKRGTA